MRHLQLQSRYKTLASSLYTEVQAQPVANPSLISINYNLANELGIELKPNDIDELLAVLSGQVPMAGISPIATVYAGHQFGSYVPQLGDGRALLLAEIIDKIGRPWEIQLKGSGITPYSRFGDGRAVLRSSIREYLAGEALHALGVPSTRSLSLIGSSEPVVRELVESAAIISRVAPTHIRFGSLEYLFHRGMHAELKQMAEFLLKYYFPELAEADDPFLELFSAIVHKTAQLFAHWQAIGFTHGVLNTDNMSVLGLTLDYGPYGFMDNFDSRYNPNHSDGAGRYSYYRQPEIGLWNLNCLAVCFSQLVNEKFLIRCLQNYRELYTQNYLDLMSQKLGLSEVVSTDLQLINELLILLEQNQVDYTRFFRKLADPNSIHLLEDMFKQKTPLQQWLKIYHQRLAGDKQTDQERIQAMLNTNPKFILRNYMAQMAIDAALKHDYSLVNTMLTIVQNPYAEHSNFDEFAESPPDWAKSICLSCSS